MNNNGKKIRPTKVILIVLFALSATALAVSFILQATRTYDAAKVMRIFVAPALFVAAVIFVLIDTQLNPNLSDNDKSRVTKGTIKMFGCGLTTIIILTIIPIIMIIGVWLLLIIGYGSSI